MFLRTVFSSLLLGLPLLQVPVSAAYEDVKCYIPSFAKSVSFGDRKNHPFADSRIDQGVLPNKMQFYWDDTWGINGISTGFSNGDYAEYGDLKGNQATFEWDALQDPISEMRIWEHQVSGNNVGISHIYIKTSSGKTFDAGIDVTNVQGTRLDIGQGVLVSVCGAFLDDGPAGTSFLGARFRQFEFAFTKSKIASVQYEGISFDPSFDQLNSMSAQSRGLKPVTMINVHNINHRQNESTTLTMTANLDTKTSHSWTESTSNTYHVGVSVQWKAETNAIAAKSELTIGETDEDGKTIITTVSTEVKPGKAAHCIAFVVEGTQDVKWHGTANVKFEDGSLLLYAAGGEYKDVQYTDIYQQCDDEDISEAQAQMQAGNGTEVDGDGKAVKRSALPRRRTGIRLQY